MLSDSKKCWEILQAIVKDWLRFQEDWKLDGKIRQKINRRQKQAMKEELGENWEQLAKQKSEAYSESVNFESFWYLSVTKQIAFWDVWIVLDGR